MTHDAKTLYVLLSTAASIGFFHTIIGIDHSLPFIVLGRAQNWPLRKVLGITALCGLGHVLSSIVLGIFGIWLGATLSNLTWVESIRGELAAWLLIGFGICYTGVSFARERRKHRYTHAHATGIVHVHEHTQEHVHSFATQQENRKTVTFWSLFIIFVLGPCEPLIPLLMVPADRWGTPGVIWVALTFASVTLTTMLFVVTLGFYSLKINVFQRFERYSHTLAGLAILLSGIAIRVLGI